MDRKYKSLLSNTAILGLGTFGSKLLVFLLMPLYTYCLTSAEYGIADIVTQSANLLMPLAALGVVDAVFRFTLDQTLDRRRVLTSGLAIILFGFLASLVIVLPFLNGTDYFNGYGWLIVLYAFTANLHSLFAQYVRGRGMNAFFAVQGMIGTAITVLLNILFLVVFKIGVLGYVLSVVISDIAVSVMIFVLVRLDRAIKPRFFDQGLVIEMLKFCIPLIPTTVFWWITNVSDRYMIKGFLGDDVNGVYAAAFKVPTILILLSGIFIEAWQFSAVTERDASSRRAHSAFFTKVFESYQGLLFISASGLIAFSKIFELLLLNDASYRGAWQYMPTLILATVFSSLVTFMGSVYLVGKKSMQSFITAAIGATVNVVLNLILIPTELGAHGAAIATFICYFVVFVIRAQNTQRYIPFDLKIRRLTVNTVVLIVQTLFMVLEINGWIFIQLLGIFVILAFNAAPILHGVMKLLRRE